MWTKIENVQHLYTAAKSKNRHIHFQKKKKKGTINEFVGYSMLKTKVFQPWHYGTKDR